MIFPKRVLEIFHLISTTTKNQQISSFLHNNQFIQKIIQFLIFHLLTLKMLRRCMTPNPHQNKNCLKQLTNVVEHSGLVTPSHRINYDTFLYVDRLTNKKVVVGDMRVDFEKKSGKTIEIEKKKNQKTHSPRKQNKHKGMEENREIDEVNDCMKMMKTTKLFQMSNLKTKLFVKGSDNAGKDQTDIDEMRKKKRQIRQFIQNYIKNISIEQFRKYMASTLDGQSKLINPNILSLSKHMSNVISKQHIQKIIQDFLLSEEEEKPPKKKITINLCDIDFPDEERLKEILFHHVFIKNKDFQYLVNPDKSKQMFSLIHQGNNHRKNFSCKFQYSSNLNFHSFEEFTEEKERHFKDIINLDKNKENDSTPEIRKKELIMTLNNGSTYDFLFLIFRWPQLINYKDSKGNTLLHLTAKNNQLEMYNAVLQRKGKNALRLKNNFGRTPNDIAKLFASIDIIERNKQITFY